jgi:hypothetical protein
MNCGEHQLHHRSRVGFVERHGRWHARSKKTAINRAKIRERIQRLSSMGCGLRSIGAGASPPLGNNIRTAISDDPENRSKLQRFGCRICRMHNSTIQQSFQWLAR